MLVKLSAYARIIKNKYAINKTVLFSNKIYCRNDIGIIQDFHGSNERGILYEISVLKRDESDYVAYVQEEDILGNVDIRKRPEFEFLSQH